jgi:hypothetical protein
MRGSTGIIEVIQKIRHELMLMKFFAPVDEIRHTQTELTI